MVTEPPAPLPSAVDLALMKRLERLAVRLVGGRVFRLTPITSFWRFQMDLLKLQRDIQKAINEAKRDKTPAGRREVEALRGTLWHARRLGDALAWLMFRRERRRIDPLTANERVPVSFEDHGSRGMIAAVEGLMPRLGVPLLHDITDLLRVGDATFFGSGRTAQTVEFKTHVAKLERRGKRTLATYEVTAIWPAGDRVPDSVATTGSAPAPRRLSLRSDPGLSRQLKRMTTAHELSKAELGKRRKVDGRPTLILEAKGEAPPRHWPLIAQLVRRAKRYRYASGAPDDAVMYLVLYDPAGLTTVDNLLDASTADLVASGILGEPEGDSLRIMGLPDTRERGPNRYEPYFLHPLPRTAIIDILYGRLAILSVFNVQRVVTALNNAGLKASLTATGELKVMCEFEADGGRWLGEMPQVNYDLHEALMEGASVYRVVTVARALADAIAGEVPEMMREEREAAEKGESTPRPRR